MRFTRLFGAAVAAVAIFATLKGSPIMGTASAAPASAASTLPAEPWRSKNPHLDADGTHFATQGLVMFEDALHQLWWPAAQGAVPVYRPVPSVLTNPNVDYPFAPGFGSGDAT